MAVISGVAVGVGMVDVGDGVGDGAVVAQAANKRATNPTQ
jgi:F0F1-type ATP synthase membrane subunit c/vacuolar-type H+-ATPase subunit K